MECLKTLSPNCLKTLSACSSKRLAELTIQGLPNMRNEHLLNSFSNSVAKKSTEYEFIRHPNDPRKRKPSTYSTIVVYINWGTSSKRQNGKQNANLSNIPTTQERGNHQIVPLCISLMVPLAKHTIFTQPHVKTATK